MSYTKFAPIAMVLLAATSSLVNCQFLQPQSHLGRLVQSITSPLVLTGQNGEGSGDSDSYGDPSSYFSQGGSSGAQDEPQAAQRPQGSRQAAALQQAPSQQRGVPQHYYGQGAGGYGGPQQGSEEDQGAPTNQRHNQQEYQMGAYLGPTIDDKEINGAFNSNDDRDDDDGPAGYDGPGGEGGKYKAASNAYGSDSPAGFGPTDGSPARGYDARQNSGAGYGPSGYEEDGADEDDAPSGRQERPRGGRQYNGLSQAASQYQQRGANYGPGSGRQTQQGGSQMVAAANGYVPYGYANGPIDITGIMAGMAGNPGSGYEAYNGDGSNPGGYGQQGRQNGRRSQAASMNQNGYYNPEGQGYGAPVGVNGQQSGGDNDDRDMDNDDD